MFEDEVLLDLIDTYYSSVCVCTVRVFVLGRRANDVMGKIGTGKLYARP